MDAAAWRRLVKRWVLPELPGLRLTRSLLHLPDTSLFLHGLLKENSGFSTRMCVEGFVQPLYAPVDHLWFNFGGRLGNLGGGVERWWQLGVDEEAEIGAEIVARYRSEVQPLFASLATPESLVRRVLSTPTWRIDSNLLEVAAYSAVMGQLADEADAAFHAARLIESDTPWVRQGIERIARVEQAWGESRSTAVALLRSWRDETAAALRLPPPEVPA